MGVVIAPDGSLIVSDWVDRSYNVHGKGRIWRIKRKGQKTSIHDRIGGGLSAPYPLARDSIAWSTQRRAPMVMGGLMQEITDPKHRANAYAIASVLGPYGSEHAAKALREDKNPEIRALGVRVSPSSAVSQVPENAPPLELAAYLRYADAHRNAGPVIKALGSDDPFLRQAARYSMQRSAPTEQLSELLEHPGASVRRGAGLVLSKRLSGAEAEQAAATLLADRDPLVRFVGIQWAGEAKMKGLAAQLEKGLDEASDNGRWIDAHLAALHLIRDGKAAEFEKQQQALLIEVLNRGEINPLLHAHLLRRVPATHPWWNPKRVEERLKHPSAAVRLETVRTLYESPQPKKSPWLLSVAKSSSEEKALRAAAVAGLDGSSNAELDALLDWATSDGHPLQAAALESLQSVKLKAPDRGRLAAAAKRSRLPSDLFDRAADLEWTAKRDVKPNDTAGLSTWLAKGKGDAARGERIFFHPRGPKCVRCHRVNGRGGAIGPDLSSIHSMKPERLLHSILEPSAEIAPQFTPWRVELSDGTIYTGLLLTEQGDNQTFANEQGVTRVLKREEIDLRTPLSNSIMPVGLANRLTDQELRDLIAYLASEKK